MESGIFFPVRTRRIYNSQGKFEIYEKTSNYLVWNDCGMGGILKEGSAMSFCSDEALLMGNMGSQGTSYLCKICCFYLHLTKLCISNILPLNIILLTIHWILSASSPDMTWMFLVGLPWLNNHVSVFVIKRSGFFSWTDKLFV